MNVFILLSCARSGSTSLARILDEAVNGRCAVEPVPNLNRETREAMDGRLEDADGIVEATVVARAVERLEEVEVYGEKNVTYGPFVEKLYKRLDCRFVLITRDGRDVVRSLINWHEARFGTIYRECREPGNLMPEAVLAAARLPVHLDTSDYARLVGATGSRADVRVLLGKNQRALFGSFEEITHRFVDENRLYPSFRGGDPTRCRILWAQGSG